MSWMSRLFSKSNGVELPAHSTGLGVTPRAIRIEGTDLLAARMAIHSTATKTAKACGIPPLWLSFEVIIIADHEKAYFQLQIIIQQWDAYFAAHSYAFERAVMKSLLTDHKRLGSAVRAVLWRTAYDAGCPYDDMPEPSTWTSEAIKKRAAALQMGMVPPVQEPAPVTQSSKTTTGRPVKRVSDKNKFDGLLDDEQYAKNRGLDNAFAKTQAFAKTEAFAATEPMATDGGGLPPR